MKQSQKPILATIYMFQKAKKTTCQPLNKDKNLLF